MAVKDDIRAVQQVSTEFIFDWWTGNTCTLDGYQVLQYRPQGWKQLDVATPSNYSVSCTPLRLWAGILASA